MALSELEDLLNEAASIKNLLFSVAIAPLKYFTKDFPQVNHIFSVVELVRFSELNLLRVGQKIFA